MKTYNQDEMFEQIKTLLSDNLKEKKFVIDDIFIAYKDNWSGENNNDRYSILVSRDYEITLKVKGL